MGLVESDSFLPGLQLGANSQLEDQNYVWIADLYGGRDYYVISGLTAVMLVSQ